MGGELGAVVTGRPVAICVGCGVGRGRGGARGGFTGLGVMGAGVGLGIGAEVNWTDNFTKEISNKGANICATESMATPDKNSWCDCEWPG